MKPLSIEELKALQVGDWVWVKVVGGKYGAYARVCEQFDVENFRYEIIECYWTDPYETYGTKWLAYKNKEQAEAKGEIVELQCKVGDTVYVPWIWDGEDGVATALVNAIGIMEDKEWKIYLNIDSDDMEYVFLYGTHLVSDYNKTWFTDKPEAERRLAELKGEKHD